MSHRSNSNTAGSSRRDRSRSRSSSSSSSTSSDGRHSPAPESRRRRERDEHRGGDTGKDSAVVTAPPPPMISRGRGFAIGRSNAMAPPINKVLPVHMKLSSSKPAEGAKKITVASAFCNDSDDDDDEEMPAECRMRMRNIGRETPTSSGPNSFGKTKQGFCDSQKIIEKNLKEAVKK